ncbi:MAG: hypothetical protein AMS22_12405 [Thiotrichales bacterium SG8_50]|nr:MAG: hypothetical protein AMS22_12405 [Thiotrichales bacterium SG8_50]
MSISMYDFSMPAMIRGLTNLVGILQKAEAHVESKGINPETLIEYRLYPDMLPFRVQVYIATDNAKGCGARLAGMTPPSYEDIENTFPDLIARVNKTIAFLQTLTREQIDGSEDKEIVLKFRTTEMTFKGLAYLTGYALPNFYFHMTTAYDILRHNGVELGKSDFLGKHE